MTHNRQKYLGDELGTFGTKAKEIWQSSKFTGQQLKRSPNFE